MTSSFSQSRVRSEAYQKYLDKHNSFSNYLVGLCAGRSGLLRLQRRETLKYFQSLSDSVDPNDEDQNNETVPLLNKSKVATASPHLITRENSNTSSGATSYRTTKQHQMPSVESVVEETYPTLPPTTNVPDIDTQSSTPSYHNLHPETGFHTTAHFPIKGPRPRRHVLDLVGACAEGAKFDIREAERIFKYEQAKAAAEALNQVVRPSPLAAHVAQFHEVERWDINGWISDTIEAQERSRNAAPKVVRHCREYEQTEKFNPLSVHQQFFPETYRKEKNADIVLAYVRQNRKTLRARQFELARDGPRQSRSEMSEEARMAADERAAQRARAASTAYYKATQARMAARARTEKARQHRTQMAKEASIAAEAEARAEEVRELRAQMAKEASIAAEAHEAKRAHVTTVLHKARDIRIAQANNINGGQDTDLSQMTEAVSDMHLTTDASAPQAINDLNSAAKPEQRKPINICRVSVPGNVRKGARTVAAAHIA